MIWFAISVICGGLALALAITGRSKEIVLTQDADTGLWTENYHPIRRKEDFPKSGLKDITPKGLDARL